MDHEKLLKKELKKYRTKAITETELQTYQDMVVAKIDKRIAGNDRKELAECLTLSIGVLLDGNAKHMILNGDHSGWGLIEQQTYWEAHIIKNAPGSIRIDSRRYGGVIGMSMLWDYDEQAAIVAAHAEKVFTGKKEKYSKVQAIHVFMVSLYHKYKSGILPEFFDLLPSDHIYRRLMAAWNNESAVASLLPEVCDYHIWSSYDDGREKMVEILTFDLIPFDIRTIELVRRTEGLSTPIFDHPLMGTPLADIPTERPGYDPHGDGILQKVIRNEIME